VPGWALERLARSATKRRLEQGAIVVRRNDEARAVYFLLSGAVQILVYFEGVGDPLMGVQRDPGSLIAGWSAFRPPYRHTSSMRCEEASELVWLPRETFEGIFEDDPYLGYQILKKVAAAVDHWLEGAVAYKRVIDLGVHLMSGARRYSGNAKPAATTLLRPSTVGDGQCS
jgi:hypothetical protein